MNPRTPTGQAPEAILYIDWSKFKDYVFGKYRRSWAVPVFAYSRKYLHLIKKPRDIDNLPSTIRSNVIKSLKILARYLGVYKEFKERLDNYGIKTNRPNALDSFLRIFNNSNTNILEWYGEAYNTFET